MLVGRSGIRVVIRGGAATDGAHPVILGAHYIILLVILCNVIIPREYNITASTMVTKQMDRLIII